MCPILEPNDFHLSSLVLLPTFAGSWVPLLSPRSLHYPSVVLLAAFSDMNAQRARRYTGGGGHPGQSLPNLGMSPLLLYALRFKQKCGVCWTHNAPSLQHQALMLPVA